MVDVLTKKQRSFCMAQIRGEDTKIERVIRSKLHKLGYRFNKNVKDLPGRPDIVFKRQKVAVFIDGDFWHGYRFPQWKDKLSPFWQKKIQDTRDRDQRNFRKLRRMGWKVIRIWQHQIKKDVDSCVARIVRELDKNT